LRSLPADPSAPEQTRRLVHSARSSVRRAAQLVADLDDLSRLHAGALELYLRPVDLDEALTATLDDLGPGGHSILLKLPERMPDVIADASLLTRVLTSLGADALRNSPPDRPPTLTGEVLPDRLVITLADGIGEAPGATGNRADSLALRLSRDLVEAMGGTLEPTAAGSAFSVRLALPTSAGRPRHADGLPNAPGTARS
jgi:two-component system, OmpR family, sensor histidine kinase KdpD